MSLFVREEKGSQDELTVSRVLNRTVLVSGIVFVVAVVGWVCFHEPAPNQLVLSTAQDDGSYYAIGEALGDACGARGLEFKVETSNGSDDNIQRLLDGGADFAIVQDTDESLPEGLAIVAPLFSEQVCVIRRNEWDDSTTAPNTCEVIANAESIYIGPENSGMRRSAEDVLSHYGHDTTDLPITGSKDIADLMIITANIHSDLMHSHWEWPNNLLPIDSEALAARHACYRATSIPAGYFGYAHIGHYTPGSSLDHSYWPRPRAAIPTIETTAYLITREDMPDATVEHVMAALYQDGLGKHQSMLIPFAEAKQHLYGRRFHPAARAVFDPFDPGPIASWVEALAGSKDLLFAIGAGLFFLWTLQRQRREKRKVEAMVIAREHLDVLLLQTIEVESELLRTQDAEALQRLRKRIMDIKHKALNELTDEELRRDRSFSIFLAQCESVVGSIRRALDRCG